MRFSEGADPDVIPNPNADKPCGVVDPSAKFPERVHYDCDECSRLLKDLLLLRAPAPKFYRRPKQGELFDLTEKKERKD